MKPIKRVNTQLASDSSIKTTVISISKYEKGAEYRNNESNIDLIVFDGSLYVYAGYGTKIFNVDDPTREADFLCVVRKGAQGIQGPKGDDGDTPEAPEFRARFDGGKVTIYSIQNGSQRRETVSPDLTGPSWKPKIEGNILSWERSWDKSTPASLNLEDLRPKEGRPILLRTNSDNTKRSDETSGPANFIQWKYEGQEEWTNLISISELMNLALAGVSVWYDEEDEKYHFGHKEIKKASYDAGKDGGQIISAVDLGDVLYDAGPLPFATSDEMNQATLDLATINAQICDLLDQIENVRLSIPDVSNCVREPIKTINGETLLGGGNIVIPVVEKTSDIRNDSGFITESALSDLATKEELNEKADKSELEGYQPAGEYLTPQDIVNKADKSEIPSKVSDLENDVPFLVESDLSDYAKKSDIPEGVDLSDYAKKSDLTPFATKDELNEAISDVVSIGDITATATYSDSISSPQVTVTSNIVGNVKNLHFAFRFPTNGQSESTESHIVINSDPAGATIKVNGNNLGIAPVEYVGNIGDTIQIRASLDGYDGVVEDVVLTSAEMSKTITLDATPVVIPITISPSQFEFASTGGTQNVTIVATEPFTVTNDPEEWLRKENNEVAADGSDYPAGTYNWTLVVEQTYDAKSEAILFTTQTTGTTETLIVDQEASAEPAQYTVNVTCVPKDAIVSINGTDVELDESGVGNAKFPVGTKIFVNAEREGYESWVNYSAGTLTSDMDVQIELTPIGGDTKFNVTPETQTINYDGSNAENLTAILDYGLVDATYTITCDNVPTWLHPAISVVDSDKQWSIALNPDDNLTGDSRSVTITVNLLANNEPTVWYDTVTITQSPEDTPISADPMIFVDAAIDDVISGIPSGYNNGEPVSESISFPLGVNIINAEDKQYGLAYKYNAGDWVIKRLDPEQGQVDDDNQEFNYGGTIVNMYEAGISRNSRNHWDFVIEPSKNNSESIVTKTIDFAIYDPAKFTILPNSWATYRLQQDAKS